MRYLSVLLAIAVTFSGFSQEVRNIEPFTKIDVDESITVYLKEGSSKQVIVEADGDKTDRVIVENVGSTLKIHMKEGSWRSYDATVYVEYQTLEEIEVSSSADLYSESTIVADDLEIEVNSSGFAELDVEVKNLDIEVSSSGKLELTGNAEYQRVAVSSSGKYYGYDLESGEAKIEANSSGKAEVTVSNKIDASASSSGRVTYRGKPEQVYADSNSSGKVVEY
ncbi:MAG: head GIN domain-containing protein [Cyclobacteriaceae bacterium]